MRLNIDALQELYSTLVNSAATMFSMSPYVDSPIDRAFRECDEKLSESAAFAHIKDLENRCENLERSNKALRDDNDKLGDKVIGLNKKNEQLEKELDARTRKHLETATQFNELASQYQRLSIENKSLQYDYNTLHRKYSECQGTVDKQAEQIRNLKAKQDSVHKNCYDQGQTDLWDMLQNVNDSQPNEFDVECESMHDVIGMDLEDFLVAYKKWQEQKEIDRMRNWLVGFCDGKCCHGCPLESVEYKCGCGYSFKKANQFDTRIIPDEDIKRYYEKARGDGDATFYFDNKPVTMETTVEVDKDLLNKVCGIKPKEEEHRLEYGDAVRVPWKRYDYMYIGPEGKHIRLFDPKTHTVVVVSVRDNLTYQGCKIILCDEDDIRKIWKDKK